MAIIAAIFLAVTSTIFFSLGFYLSPQSPLEKSDAIVAVSGGETESRAREAIKLYKEGWGSSIIFSGAAQDPDSPSNAEVMKRQAVEEGVPASDILKDEVSSDTIENALAVAEIVKVNGFKRIILVTSPYHQRRVSMTFKAKLSQDVRLLNHSATDENWRRSAWWANDYSREVTMAELQKIIYVLWFGPTRPIPALIFNTCC